MARVTTGKQRWIETWIEVAINITVGLILSLLGNYLYLWYLGYSPTLLAMSGLAILMTVLSIMRQLILRRLFEAVRVNNWLGDNNDQAN